MAELEHNTTLPAVKNVIPHRYPRLWLDGVLSVEEVPLEQYREEREGAEDPASILARLDAFKKREKPTAVAQTIVRARGFWTPAAEQFDGHFPGQPILQGVQQLEAVAQLGCYADMLKDPGQLGGLFTGAYVEFE